MEYLTENGWYLIEERHGCEIRQLHHSGAFNVIDETGDFLASYNSLPEAYAYIAGISKGWDLAQH